MIVARRRSVAVSALLAVLVGGVGACGSPEPTAAPSSTTSLYTTSPSAYEEQRDAGVIRLLDALSAALTSGRPEQVETLIDPLATPEFRRSMREAAADLAATPPSASSPAPSSSSASERRPSTAAEAPDRGDALVLRALQYRLAPNTGADRLIGGSLGIRLSEAGSTDSWVSAVTVSYALGGTAVPGVDEPLVQVDQLLAFARYGDDWKLLGDGAQIAAPDTDPEAPARPPQLVPWAFPGLRAADVPSGGGVSSVLSYPGTDRTVAKVRRQLAPAIEHVTDFWGRDWTRRAVVTVTGTERQFAGFTRTEAGQTAAAAAATVYDTIDRAGRTVTGQRVVLSPAAGQLTESGVAVILRHELFHVATRIDTAVDAPMWLTEGVAEYVGRRGSTGTLTDLAPDLAVEVAAGQLPDALPPNSAFAVDTPAARVAYQTAWSFADFVADEYGEDRLRAMYSAVARETDEAAVTAALEKTLGTSQGKMIGEWQSWLRNEVR
ncbi:hypothetical protein ACFQNE_06560 [Gordonia phosphorivorans]|uniref:Peptidase n=1 Tax=Gordonia phosphorivorans TaxID=1056982 RepID=A0ABV6H5H5_9ACTN